MCLSSALGCDTLAILAEHGCCLQLLTGKGALGQLRLETTLPPFILKASIGAIVVFNLITALLPQTTFSEENQQDVRKRPAGMLLKDNQFLEQDVCAAHCSF